jgi:hypothetical protein
MAMADRKGMKAHLLAALVPCLLCLAGCLELEQTVTIDANGSGTQQLKLDLSERVLAEVRRAASVAEPLGSNPLQIYDKETVQKELTEAGLVLKEHRTTIDKQKRHVEVEAAFADLAALKKSPLSGSHSEWAFTAGPKAGTICVTFYPQGKTMWEQAALQAQAMRDKPDPVAEQFFEKRKQQLTGLDITLRIRLPGKVLVWTRNLEKTGAQEVVAHITASQIQTPEDLVRRLAPRFQVIIDGTGCSFALDK